MTGLVTQIMRYEDGEMDEAEAVEFFASLVADGTIACLQGTYQRGAAALIRDGIINEKGEVLVDVC